MKILVACEFSGVVRNAFIAKGHEALSCDLLPSELPGPHYQGDIFDVLYDDWDMMVAFPPCTYLCRSGGRWFPYRKKEQQESLLFVLRLLKSNISKIAIENPIGILSTRWRKPDQIIQPWQFGHGETKATCLWLKNIPKLTPTDIVEERVPRVLYMPPSTNRGKERSRTLLGIAEAMAYQWG